MAELLEMIETLRTEQADVHRLFGGEGQRTSGRAKSPDYKRKLLEAANLIGDVFEGKRDLFYFREAMTTSDFPTMFGDIIDRTMLGTYREKPPTYRNYAKIGRVRDFRTVKKYAIDGGESRLGLVAEQQEYPEGSVSETPFSWAVKKYGRRFPFSWEAIMNDDLGALKDIPQRMGRSARRTEEFFASGLFVDASGPHASLYSNTNKNIVNTTNGAASNNPVLSIGALQQALIVLSKQVDADGEPIEIGMVHLVVPPALLVTAKNILNALQIELTEAGGTSAQKLIAQNWMKADFQLHSNSYIPIIASTANGNTSWFLFSDPNDGRPAIEVDFLIGHEEPETFMKEANARRVGGGTVDPLDGDFDTDSVEYKVRHVLGGGRLDPKATVASNGSAT